MTATTLHIMPGNEKTGQALADALGCAHAFVDVHRFPDGESLIRVKPGQGTALLFATLDHPNAKLVELVLAAEALKANGASRVVLVAPYLCYMRQDMAFHEGEAVSQRIIGAMLARHIDRIITVDPHLHRVSSLSEVFPGIEADSLSATGLIADAIGAVPDFSGALLVGPDGESMQWVRSVAEKAGLDFIVATKERSGDRKVDVTLPEAGKAEGRTAIIVDDIISSGMTMRRCAALLEAAGASSVAAYTVHALCSPEDLEGLKASGIQTVASSDSIHHLTNAYTLTPLLADALRKEV
ncbi:ribose-phosphate diphosphokinase [Kordiimonas marina]|uniref:ribose-phosphate diphosphokinase n=1 Tax=Kordiimonas marina TaxID=2872312 RepID=UPI001FF3D341|nr:ribose-phosphate diphosphokinase [Kordiimonas marina]MCJ9428820.1 ribose-phosphate diphosphokinase [Kordiimonas marina]